MTGTIRHASLVGLLLLFGSPGAPAQYPAVKSTAGEVKRDADLNKSGAAKPPSSFTRVPTQQGRVQQDSDWNKGIRTHIVTPPLSFTGEPVPVDTPQRTHRGITTAPLSFVGAAPAQATVKVIKTEKLDFVGIEKQ